MPAGTLRAGLPPAEGRISSARHGVRLSPPPAAFFRDSAPFRGAGGLQIRGSGGILSILFHTLKRGNPAAVSGDPRRDVEIDSESSSRLLIQPRDYHLESPLPLDCGRTLDGVSLRYETVGELNADRSNAVLITHALSGDAHVCGRHTPEDRKPGWWDNMIGPGKYIDTDRYFVICSNIIGGCAGSTGPRSINPATGRPYNLEFPVITVRDMVRAQERLVTHLGIDKLLSVVGGSMAGARLGGELPRPAPQHGSDRDRMPVFAPEHRFRLGRPRGDQGRSRVEERRLFR